MDEAEARPLAVLLMGPTASGKTDLAVGLVERFPCDIVSVDSALVYRGMDIGTAKPSPEVLARAPHRLIDICDPREAYSAARFRDDALREMRAITAAGRIPLLTGGTMLYFRALQQGLSRLPEAEPAIRADIESQAADVGWPALHRRLAEVDPATAQRVHPNDPQRIQRALEVHALTGRAMSELLREQPGAALPYRLLKIVRAPRERAVLHERIARRFADMLRQGFEMEVRRLMARGDLSPDLPSMRCVGYRQMLKYLRGETTYDQMAQAALAATRQLAKRQFTWLRAEDDCHWLLDDADAAEAAKALLEAHCPRGDSRSIVTIC